MSETYYKGVKPDGTDFYSGTVQWAPEKTKARKGRVVRHPKSKDAKLGDFTTFLSVSTDPTNLPGTSWPLRLLEVEPVNGEVLRVDACKRGGTEFRVVREVSPALHFGPMGEHVVRLIEAAGSITTDDVRNLSAAWSAAWSAAGYAAWSAAGYAARYAAAGDAAWSAAWSAAGSAAGDAAWSAAWSAAGSAAGYAAGSAARYAAGHAAGALVVRDLVGQDRFAQEQYDLLTGPWRRAIGPIHPDDEDLR